MTHTTAVTLLLDAYGQTRHRAGCSCGWQGDLVVDERDAKSANTAHKTTEQRSADLALRIDPENF